MFITSYLEKLCVTLAWLTAFWQQFFDMCTNIHIPWLWVTLSSWKQRSRDHQDLIFGGSLKCTCLMMYILGFFIQYTWLIRESEAFRALSYRPESQWTTKKPSTFNVRDMHRLKMIMGCKMKNKFWVLLCIFPKLTLCSVRGFQHFQSTSSSSHCQITLLRTGVAFLEILLFASINTSFLTGEINAGSWTCAPNATSHRQQKCTNSDISLLFAKMWSLNLSVA